MTLLNSWWRGEEDGHRERQVYLQCDGCLPPRLAFGARARLLGLGWRFEELDRGPHHCPRCARRGAPRSPLGAPPGRRALPNLIVIGAAKSGTTSLHQYLSAHPEIQMSEPKELRFFQDPGCLEKLDQYSAYFDADAAVRGEATPAYSCYPLIPGVPERIHEAIPETKLIYLVREPVERAIASYVEARAAEKEPRDVDEALADPADPYNSYVAQSRYAMQVERYLRVFEREQLLVVDQRDLLGDRAETLRRVFGFLGVQASFSSSEFDQLANTRATKRQRNRVGRLLRNSTLASAMQRIPPRSRELLLRSVRGLTSRPVELEVGPNTRRRLEDSLAGELELLTESVGPFSSRHRARAGQVSGGA